MEIANGNVEMQKRILEEKERDLTKTMNGINEDNWSKITELTNEKLILFFKNFCLFHSN